MKNSQPDPRIATRHYLMESPVTEAGLLQVVKLTRECNAAAVLLVHNHPSGDPKPRQFEHEREHRASVRDRSAFDRA